MHSEPLQIDGATRDGFPSPRTGQCLIGCVDSTNGPIIVTRLTESIAVDRMDDGIKVVYNRGSDTSIELWVAVIAVVSSL